MLSAMADETNGLAVAFYNAVRAEVIQRLALREQVLLAYLATSGVVAGVAYKSSGGVNYQTLLIIPGMSVLFTLALIRHDGIMLKIGQYIRTELRPFISGINVGGKTLVDWDESLTLTNYLTRHLIVEKCLFLLLVGGPAASALMIARDNRCQYHHIFWWAFSCFCASIAILLFNALWSLFSGMGGVVTRPREAKPTVTQTPTGLS